MTRKAIVGDDVMVYSGPRDCRWPWKRWDWSVIYNPLPEPHKQRAKVISKSSREVGVGGTALPSSPVSSVPPSSERVEGNSSKEKEKNKYDSCRKAR